MDYHDCAVCGGLHGCEFCADRPPPSLRSALWDYWAAGIIAGVPEQASRECELLERLVMPLLGHLEPAAITEEHRRALHFILMAQGLDEATVNEVLSSLSGLCGFTGTQP